MSDPVSKTTTEPCKQPDRYDRGECGYPHCGCFDKPTETTGPRLIMRHPEGCTMYHDGGTLAWFRDWRWWVWGLRNGYRFGIER